MVPPWSDRGDQSSVHTDRAELGSAPRGTERGVAAWQHVGEEHGVVGEVLLLILGQIGFVVDRAFLADQFASTAILDDSSGSM